MPDLIGNQRADARLVVFPQHGLLWRQLEQLFRFRQLFVNLIERRTTHGRLRTVPRLIADPPAKTPAGPAATGHERRTQHAEHRLLAQPTLHGENIVLRILDRQHGVLPLAGLGFSDSQIKLLHRMIARPEGLILVTGPTGSGKTTTLYSVLHHVDSESLNIMTLEDPVEYPP